LRATRATPDEASGATQAAVGADSSSAPPGEAWREGPFLRQESQDLDRVLSAPNLRHKPVIT